MVTACLSIIAMHLHIIIAISQLSYLDSPSSTSATTYGIYIKRIGSGTASLQRDWGGVTMIAMEIKG
jgi:hypothetical protein